MLTCDASAGTEASSGEQFVNCLDLSISGTSNPSPSPEATTEESTAPIDDSEATTTSAPISDPTPGSYVLPSIENGQWACNGDGYNCQSGSDAFGGGGNSGDANSHTYACVVGT